MKRFIFLLGIGILVLFSGCSNSEENQTTTEKTTKKTQKHSYSNTINQKTTELVIEENTEYLLKDEYETKLETSTKDIIDVKKTEVMSYDKIKELTRYASLLNSESVSSLIEEYVTIGSLAEQILNVNEDIINGIEFSKGELAQHYKNICDYYIAVPEYIKARTIENGSLFYDNETMLNAFSEDFSKDTDELVKLWLETLEIINIFSEKLQNNADLEMKKEDIIIISDCLKKAEVIREYYMPIN